MTNIYKLSIDDIKRVSTDYSDEFALARIAVLSTKPNSHKIPITDELLRKSGDSIKGKWVIAEYDKWKKDVTSHTPNTKIIGIIPNNADVEYVVDEFGDTTMYVDAVISKLYATDVYDLFVKDNFRNVSVEMSVVADDENYANGVEELIFYSVCVLGKDVNGSCPNANMEIIRFSADEANKYFDNKSFSLGKMEKLAEVGKRYKIDKSAKALSDDDWSNVDKTKLRNTVINAQNKSTLVKAVYLKVENNWEDAPSERLGYPIMQLKGDTFVYNRNALANAKARATQQQETEVLRKLSAIYNKLNLKEETENKEEAEEKMAKLEEENKNVVMEQPAEEAPKEDEKKLAEDADKKEEEKDEAKDEKASDNSDSDKKDDDKKEEEEKASDDSDEKKEDKKEDDDKLSEAKAQCADLEAKCAKLEAKLSELEKFKADTEEKEKMSIVNQTLAQVKEAMDSKEYAKFEAKAKDCTLETVNAWRNEVLANVATVLMSAKKDESHLRMGIEEDSKTPTSLWDRM